MIDTNRLRQTGVTSGRIVGDLATAMTEAADVIDAIREAVLNEGPAPVRHRNVMRRHREEWPTLWQAIDKALS